MSEAVAPKLRATPLPAQEARPGLMKGQAPAGTASASVVPPDASQAVRPNLIATSTSRRTAFDAPGIQISAIQNGIGGSTNVR